MADEAGMIFGLPLGFAAPIALIGLVILPVLYYLLRITPPRPRQVVFPPLRLILDLHSRQETPARMPWWLLALRLLIAALVILAVAGPIWNPVAGVDGGKGPLLIVVDDGWAAAPTWQRRLVAAAQRIIAAQRAGRPTALAFASEGARRIVLTEQARALGAINAAKPVPYLPDRAPLLEAVRSFAAERHDVAIVWITDALAAGGFASFAHGIEQIGASGGLVVVRDAAPVRALSGTENMPDALTVRVLRSAPEGPSGGTIRALDAKGVIVGRTTFDFGRATAITAQIKLPIELRNDITRLQIDGEQSTGAQALLDDRWKRRRVGIVSGTTADQSQPLLSPSYYLTRALTPFADVREIVSGSVEPIAGLLDQKIAMLILADVGVVDEPAQDRLQKFIEGGGVLVRFAGSRLAGSSDDLLPVKLRRGGRTLGGALSWEQPKHLAPFERGSPFAGLPPANETSVSRQVLAEPEPGLSSRTWAALTDGTPLITADRRGKGYLVLVHVTADTTWSNLPLSGLFVEMLHRLVDLAGRVPTGNAAEIASDLPAAATLAPTRTLDGFGELGVPPVTAKPIPATFKGHGDADHPPGFYGAADALVSVSPLGRDESIGAADVGELKSHLETLRDDASVDLRPWLLVLAAVGVLLDGLAWLWLSGALIAPLRSRAVALVVLALAGPTFAGLATAGLPGTAKAAEAPTPQLSKGDMSSVLTTRLAYVLTGDAQTDDASRLGLVALSRTLSNRTSLTPGEPVGIDPSRDELAFYPLLYWPIVATQPQPSAQAVQRVAAFMKHGGTVVFDTRDALTARPDGPPTPEARWLRKLLSGIDVPALEPVPPDHVVTKTFYLIDSFVGRTTVGQTWIEVLPPEVRNDPTQHPARAGDGVSPIIITGNDLAGAWAITANGDPLYPLVPGGNRQRELALRGGVNLVMYALTGNYKADQVHVKDLLERLGH